ncbi:MAG: UvrD-helicase domain-containing protein, partial [Turicibacter sp.]
MSAVPLGFSVREVKGNKHHRIFKLRINKGDRILYTFRPDYLRSEFKDAIIFLNYCHHDKQILQGKQIKLKSDKWVALEEEEEEVFDQQLDMTYEAFDYDPNVIITRIVNIETMREFAQRKDEKAVYYLNDEQYSCLQTHGTPTFIFGSAGSGKTTINIHKAYVLAQEHLKIGYFTYSNYLVQDALKHFQRIQVEYETPFTSEQSKRVEFQHFNTYLGVVTQKHQVIHYEQFKKWMIENQPSLLKQSTLSPYEIWKEIRGLIKGMIPKEWLDYRFDLQQLNVTADVVENMVLKKLGIIQGGALYLNAQRIYEAKKHYMDAVTLSAVELMHRYLEQYMMDHPLIDKDTYLILDEQYCQYDKKVRTIIYEVAQKYQVWLALTGNIDENDLARYFLKALVQQEVKCFDYIIADEIQDLTEIQIYCLLLLVKNRNNILFSGDYNQTIRPTYFNTGRIESLLKTSNLHGEFEKHLLLRNYRSSENIVALANEIVKLRIDTFGRYKSNDYFEEPVRPLTHPVMYLNPTPKNTLAMLQTAIKRHYVGIVVPDNEQKAKLEAWLGCKGTLFTVEEIKGIEKDYIVCYNIMSSHHMVWEEMMTGSQNMT